MHKGDNPSFWDEFIKFAYTYIYMVEFDKLW
jgi:hypothetical protein